MSTSESLPATSNVVDRDVLRARRQSDRKASKLLDITIAREDNSVLAGDDDLDVNPFYDEQESEPSTHMRRRGSLPHFFVQPFSFSLFEPRPYSAVESEPSDSLPLIENVFSTRKGAGRRTLGQILGNFSFRRRKISEGASKIAKATLPGVVPAAGIEEDPFGDEHALDQQDVRTWHESGHPSNEDRDGDTEMEQGEESPVGEGDQSGEVPRTPEKIESSSNPTTPRSSPWSTKSKRSGRWTPRTPGSAKSWKSGLSTSSELSTVSSMRRKKAKRKAMMASQMKSIQVLGTESVGAVAQATQVQETKLRYRTFDRQVRDYLRREV